MGVQEKYTGWIMRAALDILHWRNSSEAALIPDCTYAQRRRMCHFHYEHHREMHVNSIGHMLQCPQQRESRRAIALRIIDKIDNCCDSRQFRLKYVQQWKRMFSGNKQWCVCSLLLHWGVVSQNTSERKESSSSRENRSISLETFLYGAFSKSVVVHAMIGSNASSEAVDGLVNDMRSMLVEWAYAIWSDACAYDNSKPLADPLPSPLLPTQ